jgi:curved DNA-binding protein CbpA
VRTIIVHITNHLLNQHQVNNAYEVLNDPEKRLSYDRHGVWPPPNEDVRHNHDPYNPHNTTRSHPFHPNIFTFTDPFELFESFFGHPSPFHDHFPFGQARGFHDPFFAPTPFQFPQAVAMNPPDPRIGMGGGLFQNPFLHESFMPPMMGGGHFHPQGPRDGGRHVPFFSSTSSYSANRGPGGSQWASESHFTSTVNGLTTRAHECVDPSVRIFHPGDSGHLYSASRATSTPQLRIQTVTKHTQSTEYPKLWGRSMPPRPHTCLIQIPPDFPATPITITATTRTIVHKADITATTHIGIMTEVRENLSKNAYPLMWLYRLLSRLPRSTPSKRLMHSVGTLPQTSSNPLVFSLV